MPTSIDEVKGFLDEYDLRSMVDESAGVILIGFGCDPDETTYRDNDGDAHVKVVIEVMEEGGFLRVAAPFAWKLDACIHRAAVLGVLPALQGRYKMLRFDHDPQDGELQPNVELALEDASLTSDQFHRAVQAVLRGIQRFDPVIRRAMQTGEVALEILDERTRRSSSARRLAALEEEAGGSEELARVISGEGPAVDDDEAKAIFERIFGIGGEETEPRAGACDSRDGEPGGVDRGDDDGEDGEARKAG